jgi:serine/threonine protein kinase
MSTPDKDLVGRVVAGTYRLDKLVARGGFSSVFRGVHIGMDRPVAVKVLPLSDDVQATWIERFSREAKIVSQLTHPNTITIFDFGRSGDDFFYLVMEYVRGRSLSRYIKKFGPVPPERLARFTIQIARALDEAHHEGIVHRDLKPSNIMVAVASSGEESIKVLDFGVAKLLDPVPEVDIALTQAGAFVGTPRYASPEQLRRDELDHRSDIYGLGMIMWEALTGRPAVDATDYGTCIQYHLGPDPWRLPDGLGVPDALAKIVHRALEKDRAHRYISCGQMADELEEFLATHQYGQTDRLDLGATDVANLEESQELAAYVSEIVDSTDSAAEEIRSADSGSSNPVDEFFGEFLDTSASAELELFDELSELDELEHADDKTTRWSGPPRRAQPPPQPRPQPPQKTGSLGSSGSAGSFHDGQFADDEESPLLSGPSLDADGRRAPPSRVPSRARAAEPQPRQPTALERDARHHREQTAQQASWDEQLAESPFADSPLAEDPLAERGRARTSSRPEPAPARPRRPQPGKPKVSETARTRILGGIVFVILIVVASIVVVNVIDQGPTKLEDVQAGPDYEERAKAEVDKLLKEADEPKPLAADGTPTISPKAIGIALSHDGWKAGDRTENDLGDLRQVSFMVRKDEMAASVTIYSTKSPNMAEELLADTRSPAEGITFGSTMVRVAPGPSSRRNGVTPVIAHLYKFKTVVREETGQE